VDEKPGQVDRTQRKTPDAGDVTILLRKEKSAGTLPSNNNSLVAYAHQDKAIASFWDAYAKDPFEIRITNDTTMTSQSWFQAAIHESSDPTLRSALLSLALARTGRIYEDGDILRLQQQYYSESISRVRQALSDSRKAVDDHILAAVMVLSVYEVHEGSRDRATTWIAHVDGATKLIGMRGSRNIENGFARSLYFGHAMNEVRAVPSIA
jgi:hypothetical protein